MIPAKLKMGHWETLKKKKKTGIFLTSASLPLYTACRIQFNLRLKDTSGPNNSLLKLISNG